MTFGCVDRRGQYVTTLFEQETCFKTHFSYQPPCLFSSRLQVAANVELEFNADVNKQHGIDMYAIETHVNTIRNRVIGRIIMPLSF